MHLIPPRGYTDGHPYIPVERGSAKVHLASSNMILQVLMFYACRKPRRQGKIEGGYIKEGGVNSYPLQERTTLTTASVI